MIDSRLSKASAKRSAPKSKLSYLFSGKAFFSLGRMNFSENRFSFWKPTLPTMKLTATKRFKRRLPFLLGGSRIHSLGILGGIPLILNHQLVLGGWGASMMPPHSSHGRLRTSFLACFFLHKISPQTLTTVLWLGRLFTNSRYSGPSNQRWLYDTNPKSALLRKNTSLKVTIHLVYIWCLPSAMGKFNDPRILPGDHWRYSPKTWWRFFIVFFEPTPGETYFRSSSIWESFNQPNQFLKGK